MVTVPMMLPHSRWWSDTSLMTRVSVSTSRACSPIEIFGESAVWFGSRRNCKFSITSASTRGTAESGANVDAPSGSLKVADSETRFTSTAKFNGLCSGSCMSKETPSSQKSSVDIIDPQMIFGLPASTCHVPPGTDFSACSSTAGSTGRCTAGSSASPPAASVRRSGISSGRLTRCGNPPSGAVHSICTERGSFAPWIIVCSAKLTCEVSSIVRLFAMGVGSANWPAIVEQMSTGLTPSRKRTCGAPTFISKMGGVAVYGMAMLNVTASARVCRTDQESARKLGSHHLASL
mmetsp:Transcript_24937/g.63227  ORF Transcript_24937/g.63227 Transcript_24937/m.63227 type:complete len:291 (-) Transcript_24937:417-1289(-)